MYGMNSKIQAKVRILMHHTLNEVVQRDIIEEEELASGGQFRLLIYSNSMG
jgi:hypothetical protein